jgi:hypothetical protein
MDMYIHGKKTDFGASIPLFLSLSLAQLYRRYKNRLQLGPGARCIGVDMNRYAAPNLSLNVSTNSCFYDRNWVGFLIHDLTVPVI